MTKHQLNEARKKNPSGLRRLARFLKLNVEGLSDKHVVKLIWHHLKMNKMISEDDRNGVL